MRCTRGASMSWPLSALCRAATSPLVTPAVAMVQGMVSVVDPKTSWCAKWLRLK